MSHFQSYESAEDRVIRITTELLVTHVAARETAIAAHGPDAPLNEQDKARLQTLAMLRKGRHADTVNALIKVAFPDMGTKRPVGDA